MKGCGGLQQNRYQVTGRTDRMYVLDQRKSFMSETLQVTSKTLIVITDLNRDKGQTRKTIQYYSTWT